MVAAVIFDLDGVLIDSEGAWAAARQAVAREHGGIWREDATRAMMGMSSREWSRYMRTELGVPMDADAIARQVVARLSDSYREHLPLMPGVAEALGSLAVDWPLGLASSANREIIALVLDVAGLASLFDAVVSSEEVPRGKPAPDVYLEAARRLGVAPVRCAAVEDSTNGLRSAAAAGMEVIALPNREFPPAAEALALAAAVVGSLSEVRGVLDGGSP